MKELLTKQISTFQGTMILIAFSIILVGSVSVYYYSQIPKVYGIEDLNKMANTYKIELYYYNRNEDTEMGCDPKSVVAVEREMILIRLLMKETIKLLLRGELTDYEKSQGFSTEFPLQGFELTEAELENGVLTLSFDDPLNKTTGGSCRVGILWTQIEKTAKQFKTVKQVRFEPEWLFQP